MNRCRLAAIVVVLLLDAPPATAATVELSCDPSPPNQDLGIQQNYQGGDCRPGPPLSPGNLVGFAFPFVNNIGDAAIVRARIYFVDPQVSSFNLYLWSGTQLIPNDNCGDHLYKRLQAPIQGNRVFSDFTIDPPIPMALGQRIWLGAVYESTAFPPAWSLGLIDGPSQLGRSFANVTGDHRDWFDLHDFGYGQCFGVRLVIDTNEPPIADAGPPGCGAIGAPIAFDGTGSSDPDGDPLTYRWDFGDGSTATGATVSHAYVSAGSFPVVLTASDAGASGRDTTFAYIEVPFSIHVPEDFSLATAFARAATCPIDTIWVDPGTYVGPFNLASSSVVVEATEGPAVTELVASGSAPVLTLLTGSPSLRGFRVQGSGPGIRAKTAASIANCWIMDCGGTGIVIDVNQGVDVSHCLVAGNSIASNQGGGIRLLGTHSISHCTIHGNGGYAIRHQAQDDAQLVIERSILSGSLLGPAMVCAAGASPTVVCSDIWNNAGGDSICGHDGGQNVSVNPLYCDPESGDYELAADSPCLNVPVCGTMGAFDEGCGPTAGVLPSPAPHAQPIALGPAVPNPFHADTQLTFALSEPTFLRLDVHDIHGRHLRALAMGSWPAGTHHLSWDGRGEGGERLASGIYLVRLTAGKSVFVERAVLLR